MNDNKEELQFVVDHYQEGHKDVYSAWREFKNLARVEQKKSYKRILIAASIVFAVIMATAATVYVIRNISMGFKKLSPNTEQVIPDSIPKSKTNSARAKKETIVFHFDHTPVNAALNKVSNYYGVQLTTNDTTKMVTGEFEPHDISEAIKMLEITLGIEIRRK